MKRSPLQTLLATAAILGAEGMRDYRERAQAGETNDDDCELYGHDDGSEWDDDESDDGRPDGQEENTHAQPPKVG